ncbi:MAG: hypothetical protein A4E40_01456 [Methanoregulaceae archaeon PtaU1.Bin059]|nr:MAG: hypothetical protein A4E40_01456 [Methanoregulaceae archaeon PtaU1.Bin059]
MTIKKASSLFCMEYRINFIICVAHQALQLPPCFFTELIPDYSGMALNLKVTAGRPGSRAEAPRYVQGRRGALHLGCGGGQPPQMYSVRQSCRHQITTNYKTSHARGRRFSDWTGLKVIRPIQSLPTVYCADPVSDSTGYLPKWKWKGRLEPRISSHSPFHLQNHDHFAYLVNQCM